ncbi:MAG: InlB B-repeat-containing protein [Clostridia bacterium]|nr:InlB B-repeat-containing protein [Clostridia bacterium]
MKRFNLFSAILAVVLVVSMCILPAAATVAQATESKTACFRGDVNNNGEIEKYDYILVKRYIMKTVTFTDEQLVSGDVNANGELEKFDYILIKRHVMKTYTIEEKHNVISVEAKDATCTEKGNIAYFTCADCGKCFSDATAKNEITLESTVVTTNEHKTVLHEAVDVTCTENGSVAYYSCEDCEKLFLDKDAKQEIAFSQTIIVTDGHVEVIDKAVESTCSQTGLTEGKHCGACGDVLVPQTETAKKQHTPSVASCTADQTCTVCGEFLNGPSGHIEGTEATCTEDQICIVCNATLNEATGHNLEFVPEQDPVDNNNPGNRAHWYCDKCQKYYLDEAATEEVPYEYIPWKLFKITYYCDEIKSKQTVWYKLGEEVEDLLYLEIAGYDFKYWVDGNDKRVNGISANNTENIELYAKVDLEIYTIYLGGTWKYDPIEYTIEDTVVLPEPIEDGLTFAGWREEAPENSTKKVEEYTDSVGITRWRVNKGTTGDIELMAQWKDNRNLIVSDKRAAAERYINSGYDETEKVYWFLYSLGEIQNVVLDPDNSLVKTKHNGGHIAGSLTLAETTTIEKALSESVATTISHTVTSSTDWSKGSDWEETLSVGQDVNVTVGSEAGCDFAKVKAEMSVGISLEASASVGGSFEIGGGRDETDENSETIETTLAYNTSISQSKERTISFSHDVAPGNYYYANVGTVKVYAFIVFDPVKKSYELETINILNPETTTAVLSDEKKDREYVSESFLYDFDIIGIRDEVTGNYFVQYSANNLTTDNVVKMYPINTDVVLENNPFKYTGYTYVNWATNHDVKYSAGETVNNVAEPGKLLVLNAQWSANAYTVKYNANKPSNASKSVTGMPSNISAVYDSSFKLGAAPSLTGWTFGGWYSDAACTKKVGGANDTVVNLTSTLNGTVNLYAKWTANTYTVVYNANGGSGSTASTKHTVDTNGALAKSGFTRSGYTCVGWAWNKDSVTPDFVNGQNIVNQNYTANATITLYAVWVKTSSKTSFEGRSIDLSEGKSQKDEISTGFNLSNLKKNGYTKATITIKFDHKSEDDPIMFNDAKLAVVAKDATLYSNTWSLADMPGSWDDTTVSFSVNLDQLNSDGSFSVIFSQPTGTGWTEDWWLGTTIVTVTATR